MNYQNLAHLTSWLKQGAPEHLFTMQVAVAPSNTLPDDSWDFYQTNDASEDQLSKKKTDCGSVCCIAGAAAQFRGHYTPEKLAHKDWSVIQSEALEYLGLNPSKAEMRMIPLFDPDEAPHGCSPAQAAEALEIWAPHAAMGNLDFNPWEEDE